MDIEIKAGKREPAAKPKLAAKPASTKSGTMGPQPLLDAIKPPVHLDEAQMNLML